MGIGAPRPSHDGACHTPDAQAAAQGGRVAEIITPHSFRVMVVTDLLGQNVVPMEDVQYLAGHSHPQTTQIYDRRRRRVTRNIVERISV